jgi:chemotaxis protein CheC
MSPSPSLSELSEQMRDVLTESINIGFGRAAASLSELVGQKVILKVPKVSMLSVAKLSSVLGASYHDLVAVQQRFQGDITGDVVLIMDIEIAAMFIDLLSGGLGLPRRLTASDREALLEVGNILLNAYIGSFGNLLNTQINISVPMLHMHSLSKVLAAIAEDSINRYILLIETEFLLNNGAVAGHVALIIEAESIDILVNSVSSADE